MLPLQLFEVVKEAVKEALALPDSEPAREGEALTLIDFEEESVGVMLLVEDEDAALEILELGEEEGEGEPLAVRLPVHVIVLDSVAEMEPLIEREAEALPLTVRDAESVTLGNREGVLLAESDLDAVLLREGEAAVVADA